MFIDFLIYYAAIGLAFNWIMALIAILSDPYGMTKVDMGAFILTIPVWPLSLYQLIASFFVGE